MGWADEAWIVERDRKRLQRATREFKRGAVVDRRRATDGSRIARHLTCDKAYFDIDGR